MINKQETINYTAIINHLGKKTLLTFCVAVSAFFIVLQASFTLNAQKPDIYVAGNIYKKDKNTSGGYIGLNTDYIPEERKVEHFAFMEKYTDGIENKPEGFYSENASAKSVFVLNNDVYVAGTKNNGATIWKNGGFKRLSDNSNSFAESVFVSGNDYYVAGYEQNMYRNYVAVLWKNGVAQNLSDGIHDAVASSVFVAGNNVYVVGYKFDESKRRNIATLWKNSVSISLSTGKNHTYAESVFVSANDVYVIGYEINAQGKRVAKLWKNSISKDLTDGNDDAYAKSIFLFGNDVYIAGM